MSSLVGVQRWYKRLASFRVAAPQVDELFATLGGGRELRELIRLWTLDDEASSEPGRAEWGGWGGMGRDGEMAHLQRLTSRLPGFELLDLEQFAL